MAITWRHRVAVWGTFAALCAVACNPLTVPFFLMYGVDDKVPASFPLADKRGREVRAVILVSTAPDLGSMATGVDRQLTVELTRKLQELFKANGEKVELAAPYRIEKFKSDNPDWKSIGPGELGKRFGCDFVIDMEVTGLNLYEPNSHNMFYKGRSNVSIAVFDMKKTEEGSVYHDEYSIEYPRSSGPVQVSEMRPEQFRTKFLARLATDLSWQFTAHVSSDSYYVD